jgi:hypothetical protein
VTVLNSVSQSDYAEVEYRIDDRKLQSDLLKVGTSGTALFLRNNPESKGFSFNLNYFLYGSSVLHKEGTNLQVKKIILGVPEYLGGEIMMQFDLPDSAEVADACGVIAHPAHAGSPKRAQK